MDIHAGLRWLYDTEIAVAMRENAVLFPWIEGFHVLALTLVLGSILVLDLRLIGLAWRDRPLRSLLRDVLPVTLTSFAFAVATGFLLFSSNALEYADNSCLQWKLGLLGLLGLNAAAFHFWVEPALDGAHESAVLPLRARLSGAVSIVLWVAVTALGRWIGFTINAVP